MLETVFLYQYLYQFHRLPMNDLGEIVLKRRSAKLRMLDKEIDPPDYSIEFLRKSSNSSHFISWISGRLSVSNEEAERFLFHYIGHIKNTISSKGELDWKYLGKWTKDTSGQIHFADFNFTGLGQEILSAEKLIRTNPDHEVLIGDKTYSGDQLHKLLGMTKKKSTQDYTKFILAGMIILASVTALYCLMAIPKFSISHQFHQNIIVVKQKGTYKILNAE